MKKKILVVEDHSMTASVIKSEIELLGYEGIVAINGEDAIKKTSDYSPDLIVMDILLPKMNGLDAATNIRNNPKTKMVPILAATCLTLPGEREKCLQAGCNDYLPKPFTHIELDASINKLLIKDS